MQAGQTAEVVAELLEKHYDPGYQASTSRNFRQYPQALALSLAGPGEEAMAEAAGLLQRQASGIHVRLQDLSDASSDQSSVPR